MDSASSRAILRKKEARKLYSTTKQLSYSRVSFYCSTLCTTLYHIYYSTRLHYYTILKQQQQQPFKSYTSPSFKDTCVVCLTHDFPGRNLLCSSSLPLIEFLRCITTRCRPCWHHLKAHPIYKNKH